MQHSLFPDSVLRPLRELGATTAPVLTVDLKALRANYRWLQESAITAVTGAAVKANAYGLGVEDVALALQREGCHTYFVANTEEGAQLREIFGPRSGEEIFILNGGLPGEYALMMAHRLWPVLNHRDQLEQWISAVKAHRTRDVHAALHVDTGMNRLGFGLSEASALLENADLMREIGLTLVMSHLACADEPGHVLNAHQLNRFQALGKQVISRTPHLRLSLANSAGIFLGPSYWFDLTRPGIALYGGSPDVKRTVEMSPVARLHAPIIQIRQLSKGDSVGYGAHYVAPGPRVAATLATGYADGFLRAGGGGGYGWLDGVRTPMLGRVSMDLIVVDVTDVANPQIGDMVELVGEHVLLDDVAQAAGTISYEVLTRLADRCVRRVVGAHEPLDALVMGDAG